MKTSTKVLLVINIIALVATAVLFPALLSIISYQPAFTLSFTAQSIVALILFSIWLITGGILFAKFLKRLSFPRKLFFVTVTYTGVFALIVVALLNVRQINYAPINAFANMAGVGTNMTIVYVLIGIFSALFIVALSLTFRKLSRPIKKINVILGELNNNVHRDSYKIGGGKEFVEISNQLTSLDQKMRDQEKLLKIANDEYEKVVPKQIMRHLGVKNFSNLQIGENVSKEVTTMFCDLENSTQKSETLTPSENFKFINDYLGIISPIVRRHNGFVDKYLGDGVLAVFARPQDGVDCAKDIVKQINIKNKENSLPYQMEVKIGIHTGQVVLGVVGDEGRKSPTIVSDTVNYTAKMQEVNEIYKSHVILSKATLSLLKSSTNYRYLGQLNLDGNFRFAIYELLDVLPVEKLKCALSSKTQFEQAVRMLESGQKQQAKTLFLQLSKQCSDDEVIKTFLERCQMTKK